MKKQAFTVAEIMIVLVIVGLIASVVMRTSKTTNYQDKTNIARAYKAIDEFNQASASIMATDPSNCPMGTFMQKVGKNSDGTYDYEVTLVLPQNDKEQAVLDIYGEHMKFEKTNLNFCDYSKYCETLNDGTTNIPAVRFANTIYAGVKLYNEIQDCPSYYLPETEGQLTPRSRIKEGVPKCWARLFIDVNGMDGPNEEGKDIFVFGLDEYGIYH